MCDYCGNEHCPGCGCSAAPCGPGPGNVPITDCEYQNSPVVTALAAIDLARREAHRAGARPYRVRLVWEKRNARQKFERQREVELVPVLISDAAPIHAVNWDSTEWARRRNGDLLLTQISPRQVTEDELRGRLNGEPVPPGWRFFYEVERIPLCPTDVQTKRERYTPAGVPELVISEWVIRISVQDNNPGPNGEDTTHTPAKPGGGFDKLRR